MELKAGYKQTEVGVIPEDWEVCPVNQKGKVITGKALAASAPGTQRPYLRTKNVFDGRIDIEDVLTMPMTDEQFAQFRIRNGDVLLNEGQSLELVGRTAIYREEYPSPCAIQNALLRFRAHKEVSETFASYLFRHCQKTGVFAQIALQTTSIAHLGGSRLERLCLPWPKAKAEQEAIAEALSDTDAWIESLEQLIAKKRRIKAGTMQVLLTGKKRLQGFEAKTGYKQTEVGYIPNDWECARVGDNVDLLTGFPFPSGKYTENGIRLLRGSNVKRGETVWSEDNTQFWPKITTEIRKYTLQVDDIIIAMDGSLVGRSFSQLSPSDVPALLLQRVARLRSKSIDQNYLAAWICSKFFTEHCDSVKTVTAIPHISPADIRSYQFALPPTKAEQTAIAEILSNMDSELDALEANLIKARQIKQGMMQELLTGKTRLV
ncbi:restriction endonuclease subunit S [Puniceicoccaceae bacterium K14]|nr:restriction endonuclease subunit S [Puniceicoccaceae bacterium K14]